MKKPKAEKGRWILETKLANTSDPWIGPSGVYDTWEEVQTLGRRLIELNSPKYMFRLRDSYTNTIVSTEEE